ncbi:uncharacterized protein G2W53_028902 [Senna tora]|uniref:Uncharacterized protein n=1 Tax=Senna tora TaxID=362788 RepID=A0A834T490_9FABA|nr:uncharacterized protein G2W53_028902 [Senna tora]
MVIYSLSNRGTRLWYCAKPNRERICLVSLSANRDFVSLLKVQILRWQRSKKI